MATSLSLEESKLHHFMSPQEMNNKHLFKTKKVIEQRQKKVM